MKSIIRYLSWGLGALALVVLVAIGAFALLFDPNALRDDITRAVADKTGRELVIEGELSLSFYPWLGFTAGKTTLSNPPGFDQPQMARFDSASASIKLLPLLGKRVELSMITLDGLDLFLQRKRDGKTNWDDLAALSGDGTAEEPAGDSAGFSTESIGGVRLAGASVRFVDEEAASTYELSDLNLETGALSPGKAFALSGGGRLVSRNPDVEGEAKLEGEIGMDDAGVVTIASPSLVFDTSGETIPGDKLRIAITGKRLVLDDEELVMEAPEMQLDGTGSGDPWNTLDATITGNTLAMSGFDKFEVAAPRVNGTIHSPSWPEGLEARMKGEQLDGSVDKQTASLDALQVETLGLYIQSPKIKATSIIDAPAFSGPIDIAKFEPRKVLAQVGADDIQTADPDALSSLELSGEASYDEEKMRLRKIDAKLDQTAITGALTYTSAGRVVFDLDVDEVNIDRYRAPSETDDGGAAAGVEEVVIPVEELRALGLSGKLAIGKMQLVGLKSTDVKLELSARDGDIRVNPARASLYGGSYSGDIRLDVRGNKPVLSLNESLDNVAFGPFSADLLDAERLTGKLDGRMTVSGTGGTATEITASANGDLSFSFEDGAYEGTDVWYQVRRARAMLEGDAPPAAPTDPRTEFADLTGTGSITDGVLTTNDLSMVLPFMKVSGSGRLELVSQQMDFRFRGDLVDRPELTADVDDLVGISIPLTVKGPVSAPSIGVDMRAVLADLAKRKLGEKLGLVDEESGQTTDEAIDQKKEELKDKVEDKLKDKLKDIFGGGG